MWRWSYGWIYQGRKLVVFSTYVEVIPWPVTRATFSSGILHVCGGDPKVTDLFNKKMAYSPRMWRWSQLQTDFGSHLLSILHVCGGDPRLENNPIYSTSYSPRMWRWSLRRRWCKNHARVFSTYVEVILIKSMETGHHRSILHVCGGDPTWTC